MTVVVASASILWTQAGAPQEQTLVPRGSEKPSFNCAQAKTAAARLICADAVLAQIDGDLGIAFQKRKAQISSADQSKLVSEQLAWIRDRNARCELVGKNTAVIEVLASSKPCMVTAIQQRIAYLAQTEVTPAPAVAGGQPLQLAPPSGQASPRGALPSVVAAEQFEDGRAAFKRGDYATALRLWNPLAEQGHALAQFNIGVMYSTGTGVPEDDSEAVYWLRKAADQGRAEAQEFLGTMYLAGRGVTENTVEAAKWLRKAAEQGNARAQGILGDLYSFGMHGVPLDYAESLKWLRKAANQGNADAQKSIGDHYANGYGVPKDSAEAAKWYRMAADQRHADAQKKLEGVLANGQAPLPNKTESGATSGTAFFVTRGTAVTNAHVVERCQQILVSGDGQNGTARLLARDENNDLALLTTDLHPIQTSKWRLSVRQGEDIVVYGFPLTGVLASGGNVATGNVTALAGLGNDSRFLQISAPVQPGNSGGPLLDRAGNVVGIVVSKLNAIGIASVTGDIPQNVNFAIKASVVAAFLDAQGVAHSEGEASSTLSTPDIAARAKAFTAQVVCIR
jgi:TPR repeat protein/uncharacterized protein YecT (DUF1311 family)